MKPQQKRVRKPAASAFTLIELLVVVVIIAVLLTLLLPVLGRVRESLRTLNCASNMRIIGHSMFTFALDQGNRLPGSGQLHDPQTGWSSSVSWVNQLNELKYTPAPIQRMGPRPNKGQIYCPSMNSPGGYPRAYRMNLYMAGGQTSDTYPAGPYGKEVDVYWYPSSKVLKMRIGAPISMATRPNVMFLVSENERTNDYADGNAAAPGYPSIPHNNPESVPWAHAPDNTWAFRHSGGVNATGYDDPSWQSWTANFLFVDGHIERLGPRDEIRTARRNRF